MGEGVGVDIRVGVGVGVGIGSGRGVVERLAKLVGAVSNVGVARDSIVASTAASTVAAKSRVESVVCGGEQANGRANSATVTSAIVLSIRASNGLR